MWTQLAVANTATGARNIGHAPTQRAMPKVTMVRPRYIGLRVRPYGPLTTSFLFSGEVGLSSVPARRNITTAHTGGAQPSRTRAIPSGTFVRPGGQPNVPLI